MRVHIAELIRFTPQELQERLKTLIIEVRMKKARVVVRQNAIRVKIKTIRQNSHVNQACLEFSPSMLYSLYIRFDCSQFCGRESTRLQQGSTEFNKRAPNVSTRIT